ncbi:MAG: phytoene desaturase [Archangium gephyra]|uniref:Phytoene desaturase n=1 Tax=Archangium gephyra TaxID=48 RepID=A0A2W5T1X9_9BACT|nr:MAG: phytoene desaturase [Archangium gephyra]
MKKVAVIGAGFGGMTAAAELARAGHQVTLFEQASTLGGKAQLVTHAGVKLDTGPTLLTMPHVVEQTFSRLGAADLLPRFHRLTHHARYTWSDGRTFDCGDDLEQTAASASTFEDGNSIHRFYEDAKNIHYAAGEPYLEAPFEGTLAFMTRVARRGVASALAGLKMSSLDSLARKHFTSPQLQQFVGRFATYAGASPYEASAAFAMIPHIERAFGVHHVEGGMAGLVAAFGKALERLGVTIRYGARASWKQHGRSLVAGPSGDEHEFDSIVVNQDPLLGTHEPLALSGYVLLLDADRRLSLPHHSIAFTDDPKTEFAALFRGEQPYATTVYVCHPAASDASVAPQGRSGLFVMVNSPALRGEADVGRWTQHATQLRALCVETVKKLAPEARDANIAIVGERTPVDLARGGAPGGSIYGFLPHGKFGPFARPKMRSKTRGVFYAGGGTHPGGGVPMVMLSGHFASTLVEQHLGGRS